MTDERAVLTAVFQDTMKLCEENEILRAQVVQNRSDTVLYGAQDELPIPEPNGMPCEVVVTKSKTLEAARLWHDAHPADRIAVLNFASAISPGGGVAHGSRAQEESLCRCSTLYPALNQRFLWNGYYLPNRAAKDVLHTDDCIFTPNVLVVKTDDDVPVRTDPVKWFPVDVITCAAPNLKRKPGSPFNAEGGKPVVLTADEQTALHEKRAKHILHVAAANNADVLILGAFGCGAFYNDPCAVAKAYRSALSEYRCCFKRIEFAVFCRGYETENYKAFRDTLAN